MATNLDSIQSLTSVIFTILPSRCLLKIEFARPLDREVLKDIQGLRDRPFVRHFFFITNQRVLDIFLDSNYSLAEVAEAIAQMIEGHGLRVSRKVGVKDRIDVSSFAD